MTALVGVAATVLAVSAELSVARLASPQHSATDSPAARQDDDGVSILSYLAGNSTASRVCASFDNLAAAAPDGN